MKIKISSPRLDPTIRTLRELAYRRVDLRRVHQVVRRYVAAWYAQRPEWFDTLNSPTHGAGREDTDWMAPLRKESAWVVREEGDGFTCELRSTDAFRAQFWGQVMGMVITPKQARALTIPMIPEAHGKTVREFEARYGTRLFRPRGKDYLAEDAGKGIRVAYLLRKRAIVPPLLERNGNQPFPWRTDSFRKALNKLMTYGLGQHVGNALKVRIGNQNYSI